MMLFIKDLFSKCDEILKKSLMENFIFCAMSTTVITIQYI